MIKASLIVPIYNEEENIPYLLDELVEFVRAHDFDAILVDDGSSDRTSILLGGVKNKRIRVVTHDFNKGVGAAIKTGIRCCQSDYCVTMDADGQHKLPDVEKLIHTVVNDHCELVVGERVSTKPSGWYRRLGKSFIKLFTMLLLKKKVNDLNSGLRLFYVPLAKKYLPFLPDGFSFCEVSSILYLYQHHMVATVPVEAAPRRRGRSTVSTKHAFEAIIEIINVFMLFSPMRIFLPVSVFLVFLGVAWGLPYFLTGHGLSVGALLFINTGVLAFFFGLVAEQLSRIRKSLSGISD